MEQDLVDLAKELSQWQENVGKFPKKLALIDQFDQRLNATNGEVELMRDRLKAIPEHQSQIDALTNNHLTFNEEIDLHKAAINDT